MDVLNRNHEDQPTPIEHHTVMSIFCLFYNRLKSIWAQVPLNAVFTGERFPTLEDENITLAKRGMNMKWPS